MGTAALVVAGATVAAAGISAYASSSAADKSSKTIQRGQDQANARIGPYASAGLPAVTALSDLSGLNGPEAGAARMGDFTTSPGYDWRLSEGLRSIDAGAASKGILRSGATIKAEQTFGQGLASGEFDKYIARLSDLMHTGQASATGQATTDASAAAALASIYGKEGTNQAAAIGQIGGAAGNVLSKYAANGGFSGGGSGSGGYVDTTSTFGGPAAGVGAVDYNSSF